MRHKNERSNCDNNTVNFKFSKSPFLGFCFLYTNPFSFCFSNEFPPCRQTPSLDTNHKMEFEPTRAQQGDKALLSADSLPPIKYEYCSPYMQWLWRSLSCICEYRIDAQVFFGIFLLRPAQAPSAAALCSAAPAHMHGAIAAAAISSQLKHHSTRPTPIDGSRIPPITSQRPRF